MMNYYSYKDKKKDYLYTMKRVKLLGLFVLCLAFASCDHCIIPSGKYEHSLVVYMAADNSLSDLALANMNELVANASVPKDHALLVFIDRKNTGAYLIRIGNANNTVYLDTLVSYGSVNAAHPDLLRQVLGHSREECPARSYGLILWSHGTGWLPKGLYGEMPRYPIQPLSAVTPFLYDIHDPAYPGTKTFGQDGSSEMEIHDLAQVLKDFEHHYICFDACLMADVQTYYQLRSVCEYIMGSPAEIIDTGFPYDKLASVMFPYRGQASLTALCDAYYNKYNSKSGYNRSGTISLVRTEHLEELAQKFKILVTNGETDPSMIDRAALQTYDRLTEHIFWDLDQMAGMLGKTADYENFRNAVNKTVIYKKTTENFITIPIHHFSGLAAYLPTTVLPGTQSAFRSTPWNVYLEWVTE